MPRLLLVGVLFATTGLPFAARAATREARVLAQDLVLPAPTYAGFARDMQRVGLP